MKKKTVIQELSEEQKQRFAELAAERKVHDPIRKLTKSEFLGVADLNIRLSQYNQQFHYSIEYLIAQIMNDFRNEITVIQLKDFDFKKPVAMYNGKLIYFNGSTFSNEGIETK